MIEIGNILSLIGIPLSSSEMNSYHDIEIRATSNVIGIETQLLRPADRATSQAKQATGQFLSLSQLYQPLR